MVSAKNHDEYCKSKHSLCTGNCHMKIDCEECKNIWRAATIAAEEKTTAAQPADAQQVNTAIALLKEAVLHANKHKLWKWFHDNEQAINAVVAQQQ